MGMTCAFTLLAIISLFPMPITPSSLYPHPFVATPASLGPFEHAYNRITHRLLNYGWFLGMRTQINSWREKLGLQPWNRYNAYGMRCLLRIF
jgi:hypothetical protein